MEQYEPLDLTKQFNIQNEELDDYVAQVNKKPLYQSSSPESRPVNIVNIVNGHSRHSYMPSTHGPGRSSASRRVALVQPQRGENTKVRGRDNRNKCHPKIVKHESFNPPSLHTLMSTESDIMPMNQEMRDMAILQANTLPGAQSVDGQHYLLLTPEQLMPLARGQLGMAALDPLNTATVVQSTRQNIRIENVTQFPSSLISSGCQDTMMSAPTRTLAGVTGSVNATPASHLCRTSTSPFSFEQDGFTIPEDFRLPANQMLVGMSNGETNSGRQLQVSADKDIRNIGGFSINTGQDVSDNFSQEMQVINVRSLRDSNADLRAGNSQPVRRRYQAKKNDLRKVNSDMLPNVMKGQIDARLQAVSDELQSLNNSCVTTTKNVHISTCHTIHEQHTDASKHMSSGTHQRPSVHKPKYPIVTALLQDDPIDPPALTSTQSQVMSEPDRLAFRDAPTCDITKQPIQHQTNQNGYLSYRRGSLQDKSAQHGPQSEYTHESVKRRKLEMFEKLDKQEKTVLLREKYAELLKRRRKQLHTFDPRYKISLRKMKHASRELKNLSVMTKLNSPPKFKSKISQNRPGVKSRSISSSTEDYEHNTAKEPIVIDLTGDEPSPTQHDKEQNDEDTTQPSDRCGSRLPSYEEALVTKETLSVEGMSSLARRLLSSSQEFLKNFHSPTKPLPSGEALRIENTSTELITMDLFDDSHMKHYTNQEQLDYSQCHFNICPDGNELQSTSKAQELSSPNTSAEVFTNQEQLEYSQCNFNICPKGNELPSTSEALEMSPPSIASSDMFFETGDLHSWPTVDQSPTCLLQRPDVSVPRVIDTSTTDTAAANQSKVSEFEMKKDDSAQEDKEGSPPLHPGVSNGTSEVSLDSATHQRGPTWTEMDTIFLGNEKHTLKNAIVRIQDIRKKSRERRKDDIRSPFSNIKRRPRRRRRSNNDLPKKRKRKTSPWPMGATRSRSSSPGSHFAFRDFVPTIMPSRTRATTSGHITSCQTLAMELLQYDLDDAINDGTEFEHDVDNVLDEDYSPHKKHVRRHQVKRQKSTSEESETTARAHPLETASGSIQSTSESGPYQPLRVEVGTNDQNHIRLKFLNLRSIRNEPKSHRKHRRKTKHDKDKHNDTTAVTDHEEYFKVDTGSPSEERQNAKNVNGGEMIDYNSNEMKDAKLYDVIPHPPPALEKLIINKKVGETLLHRAAKLGNMDILRYCISDEDVNARDKAGYTPLHDSCVPGHLQVAQLLLHHGADVNSEASDGTRPIHDAVENNHVDLVHLLLDHGADPFLTTATGRTAVQQALDRSSEMRSLILRFLEDMEVEKHRDECLEPPCLRLCNNNHDDGLDRT